VHSGVFICARYWIMAYNTDIKLSNVMSSTICTLRIAGASFCLSDDVCLGGLGGSICRVVLI